jgi:hypothetical protein
MTQKELITRLIKNDLKSQSLVNSFEVIGFYTEVYCLDLSDMIFKILKIDDNNDELFELYLEKCNELSKPNIFKNKEMLEKASEDIYGMLMSIDNK